MFNRALICILFLAVQPFSLPAQTTGSTKSPQQKDATTVKAPKVKPPKPTPVRQPSVKRDSRPHPARIVSAKKQFMIDTGYPKGRPGYVVDYITPLQCGGADTPANMQWLTIEDAKIKHRAERNCRGV
jgi:hypothetical protein